jgi:hypothetical protein
MFAIPQIISVPALAGMGATAIEWPSVGAFLAWMMIAAFVGTLLGMLRNMAALPPSDRGVDSVRPTNRLPADTTLAADHHHREAA